MAGFAAGDVITAQKLNWLAPKWYSAQATNTTGPSATTDIPGLTQTISTETAGAIATLWWFVSFYASSTAPTTNGTAQAFLDGVGVGNFIIADHRVGSAKWTPGQSIQMTVASAGSHTFKVQAITPANMTTAIYCSLTIAIQETF